MHVVRRRASEIALSVSRLAVLSATCAFGAAGATVAQALQPFLQPRGEAHFSLSPTMAALDLNRDGSVDVLSPGLFFGTVLATLDERGNTLAKKNLNVGIVPSPRSPIVPTPRSMTSGDLDNDGRDDLVFTLSDGTVMMQRNLGSTRIDRPKLANHQYVDYVGGMMPLNPPFSIATFSKLEVLDLNGDGNDDILMGCGVHDTWSAIAGPGIVCVYLSNGAGSFQQIRYPVSGCVIDAEWADIDGDGVEETLVVIHETGSVGAFTYELLHLQLQNGNLVSTAPPLLLGPWRPVALEMGDVDLDGFPDYVVAMLNSGGIAVDASVVCFRGDGAGTPDVGNYLTLPMPAQPGSAVGTYIPSVQVEDFNNDGVLDVAALRGYTTTFPTINQSAEMGGGDVVVCMGPLPFNATPESVPLASTFSFSHCLRQACSVLPIRAEPDQLFVLDLGSDNTPDLMISATRPVGSPTSVERVTLLNSTPPQYGDCALHKVGEPSGGDPLLPARIGFDGGDPRIGNSSFACTIQNLHHNSLCGLMWGPWGQANLATVYGFDLNLAPQHFGYPLVSSGPPNHGFGSYSLPIPNDPALIGDAGYFQYNYYDPAVDAFGATQATQVWIGS